MKKNYTTLLAIAILLWTSSCGVNSALVANHNHNSTEVHLTTDNYNVIRQVAGSADQDYFMLIGGMQTHLYQTAYSNMIKGAELTGSQALINIVTEEHTGGFFPFCYKKTITVSGQLIEFTR